jgi:hypothetical protein
VAERPSILKNGHPCIFEVLWKVSCLHPIWRHLQDYTALAKVFESFWLKLHYTDNYRTFRSAWHCEMIYTDKVAGALQNAL